MKLKLDNFNILESSPNRLRASYFFKHENRNYKCVAELYGNASTPSYINLQMLSVELGWVVILTNEDICSKFTWSPMQCTNEYRECIIEARSNALAENETLVKTIFKALREALTTL
jgi:hypothetical protein